MKTKQFPVFGKTGPSAVKYAQLKYIKISLVSSPRSSLHVPVTAAVRDAILGTPICFRHIGPGTFKPDFFEKKN